MHQFDLKNRTAIITGGAQGFGLDIAKRFLNSGVKTIIWDIDEKELQNKLVAAYIPGIGVKPTLFKTIKPMTKPDETGGFVSWNTYKKGYYPNDKNWYDGSVTSNPITWDDSKITTLEQHKGFLYTNKKIYD